MALTILLYVVTLLIVFLVALMSVPFAEVWDYIKFTKEHIPGRMLKRDRLLAGIGCVLTPLTLMLAIRTTSHDLDPRDIPWVLICTSFIFYTGHGLVTVVASAIHNLRHPATAAPRPSVSR